MTVVRSFVVWFKDEDGDFSCGKEFQLDRAINVGEWIDDDGRLHLQLFDSDESEILKMCNINLEM